MPNAILFSRDWINEFNAQGHLDPASPSVLSVSVGVQDGRGITGPVVLLAHEVGAFSFLTANTSKTAELTLSYTGFAKLAGRSMGDLIESGDLVGAIVAVRNEVAPALEEFMWRHGLAFGSSGWIVPNWPTFTR